jgi:outer membrane protein TolC
MTMRMMSCVVLVCMLPTIASAQSAQMALRAGERLTLDTAVRLAVENNRQLASARLEVAKADDGIAIARTHRLPIFSTEANASQLLSPVSFSFPAGSFGDFPATGPIPSADTTVSVPRAPTVYVSSSVSQPLTQLIKVNLGIKNALAVKEIEGERVRSTQLTVVNNVKRLYFAILQTQSALVANAEAIELYRELDRTVQVRVAQQVSLKSDGLDIQFRLAQEELTRTTTLNALDSQKEQLNQLMGRDVRTPFDVEGVSALSVLDVDVEAAQRHALESRPDVRQARLTVKQAEIDKRLTRADRIPEISAAVSYVSNFNIDIMPTNLATAGVKVKWEPFDWGRRSRELTTKERTLEQAKLAVRDAEDRAAVDISARFRTLNEKRALLRVTEMAQATAREKVRVKTNQYQVQAAMLPDVLQLRAELASSNDHYQQALLAFWTAKADFELAIGEEVIR